MPKKILFIHPDLGIGGAERLVVDAALAFKRKGHSVSFVTTHHDLKHCFAETRDGTLPVTVVADWIPRSIFGKFYALCAYMRMIYAALYIVCFDGNVPDVIFCDIVSACIPVLKLSNSKVIYYCHFPDQLLSVPGSMLKDLYRKPLNWIEEKTTDCADIILVNSKFTQKVFAETFKSIQKVPDILYPSINTEFFAQNAPGFEEVKTELDPLSNCFCQDNFTFLSINRYERKKNISLAVDAVFALKDLVNENEWGKINLVIAGGYDNRVQENLEYFEELKEKVVQYELQKKVHFLKSPSDLVKLFLLNHCNCLLYTPSNEHFGIVPLEAMYCQKPVIAVRSGGPTETVVDKETGFLCAPSKEDFSLAMVKFIQNTELEKKFGAAGKKRFQEKFSFAAFMDHLNVIVENIAEVDSRKTQ